MPIDADSFRDALRHFPAGVTVVTIRAAGQVHGLTVSAFMSISPEPPLIAIAVDHQHSAHTLLKKSDAVFAVNILGAEQEDLSNRFAFLKDGDRFAEGAWSEGATGAPVLDNALAWLDCSVHARHRAGTHTIYVGHVEACRVAHPDHPPLVYWNRAYRRLADEPGG